METDWLELWRKLSVSINQNKKKQKTPWYEARFDKKTSWRPDPLLDFVMESIDSRKTFLDVGAGSGRWTITVAKVAKSVTAIEPSPAMLDMLRENIAEAKLTNIGVLESQWEDARVEPHDVVACTHAIYTTDDFAGFVRKIERHTRERCYLVLRLPPYDGIIGELSRAIYGHPYDSPNAIIAYNALYSMRINPNVLTENDIHPWVDSTVEEAFERAKRHLHIELSEEYDGLVRETLKRRLTFSNGSYVWPDGMRSVLLWWSPAGTGK